METPRVDPWGNAARDQADTVFDTLLADPGPIPEPPGLIRTLLSRLGVDTRGDLARVALASVATMQGVGSTKVETLRAWRIDVLGVDATAASEAVAPLPPELAARHLTRVPSLLHNLFASLDVTTVGDLMAIDLRDLRSMWGVGDLKIELVRQLQDAARTEAAQPVPVYTPPPDLNALEAMVVGSVTGRDRILVDRRLIGGATLLECGQELGLSRERVRQLCSRILDQLRMDLGDHAASLLCRECWVSPAEDRAFHREMAASATVSFERLRLPLALVAEGWTLVDDDWMVCGGTAELDQLLDDVEAWLRGRSSIEFSELERAPVRQPLLGIILSKHCGMRTEGDAWVVDVSRFDRTEFLEDQLCRAGTAHQEDLARALLAHQGTEATAGELLRAVRTVERILSTQPWAYRTAMGTFTHRDSLPLSEPVLARLVERCVDQMRGAAGAVNTRVLLDQLRREENIAAVVSPWLLKDALTRHPDIKTLRKFLVGYAPTFEEEGVLLADRLEAILQKARMPLRMKQIIAGLPEGLEHGKPAICKLLRNGGFAASVGHGLYIWIPDVADRSGRAS